MAKITEYTELAELAADDVALVVDTSANETKKAKPPSIVKNSGALLEDGTVPLQAPLDLNGNTIVGQFLDVQTKSAAYALIDAHAGQLHVLDTDAAAGDIPVTVDQATAGLVVTLATQGTGGNGTIQAGAGVTLHPAGPHTLAQDKMAQVIYTTATDAWVVGDVS